MRTSEPETPKGPPVATRSRRRPTAAVVPIATPNDPLVLECGRPLSHAVLAYESFGPLDAAQTVLICHALTGDAHVTRHDPDDAEIRPGWWETLVGPGRAIDTDRIRVLCSNVLGGCTGSTGPTSIDPTTGRPYGPDFPPVSIADMVRAQRRLLDALGISEPVTVIGGSIGGFQVLEWIRMAPDRLAGAAVIGSAAALDAYGIAHNTIARSLILHDPDFRGGHYSPESPPARGLAAARQLAHLTYRTPQSFNRRFGRRVESGSFLVEGYLDHQGESFVRRFDANTYLGLLDAMNGFDALRDDRLQAGLRRLAGPLAVVGFSTDRLFPPTQSIELGRIAAEAGARCSVEILETDDGHDAFLLPLPGLDLTIHDLLRAASTS